MTGEWNIRIRYENIRRPEPGIKTALEVSNLHLALEDHPEEPVVRLEVIVLRIGQRRSVQVRNLLEALFELVALPLRIAFYHATNLAGLEDQEEQVARVRIVISIVVIPVGYPGENDVLAL